MQDALGGTFNLVLIAVFLVIISGVLGFTVNYTKAFKMKNIVISAMEEYEAARCVGEGSEGSACREKIKEEARRIGYSPSALSCSDQYTAYDGLFCATENKIKSSKDSSRYVSYRIITQVDADFPIIRNIMSFSFFQVSGDTRVIQKPSTR